MPSVRGRLLVLLLPALFIVIAIVAGSGYLAASQRINAFLDRDLAESARVLLLWTLAEPRRGDEVKGANVRRELDELFGRRNGPAPSLEYVLSRPGVIARVSSSSAVDTLAACRRDGGGETNDVDGRRWHVYSLAGGDPTARVCVAQLASERRAVIVGTLLPSLRWWLLVLPVATAVIWLGVRRGLAPLGAITSELEGRDPQDLAPVRSAAPLEVKPLIEALNRLLARQRELLSRERRFSAEAAHELRNPLATVRLRAERALTLLGGDDTHSARPRPPAPNLRHPRMTDPSSPTVPVTDSPVPDSPVPDSPGPDSPGPDSPGPGSSIKGSSIAASMIPDSRLPVGRGRDPQVGEQLPRVSEHLTSIITESVRAERVLDQLLTLARVDAADAHGSGLVPMPLLPMLRELLASTADVALARDVSLALEIAPEHESAQPAVQAEPVSLQFMLRNLLDNAVRYTAPGTTVQVRVALLRDQVQIDIIDAGPGIAPTQRRRLCEPFQRGSRHDESGTGLGLAIARRVATLHGTRLHMDDGPGGRGLTVGVRLARWQGPPP